MSQYRYELLVVINPTASVPQRTYLDTYGNDSIEIDLAIQDINDITSSSGSSSKTITLPGSKKNMAAFGFINNLNSQPANFNVLEPIVAYIMVNRQIVFQGNLFIQGVGMDMNGDTTFDCVIVNGVVTLYQAVGELYISQLNLQRYGHEYNIDSITQSWANDWNSGYYYPLVDYGYDWTLNDIQGAQYSTLVNGPNLLNENYISVDDMFPATYLKVVVDEILLEAGYTYNSNFMNTPYYENLLIPFDNGNITVGASYSLPLEFSVGLTQSLSVIYPYKTVFNSGGVAYTLPIVPFTDTTDNNYFDNGSPVPFWDKSPTYSYIKPDTSIYSQNFNVYLEMFLPTVGGVINYFGFDSVSVILNRSFPQYNKFGASPTYNIMNATRTADSCLVINNGTWAQNVIIESNDTTGCTFSVLCEFDTLDNSSSYSESIGWTERVYAQVYFGAKQNQWINHNQAIATLTPNTHIYNEISSTLITNQLIDYSQILSQTVKQKDFLLWVIKLFNLYIEPDKNNPYHLYIEPYVDYYNSGNIIDWTKKVDANQPLSSQLLSLQQSKQNIFSYKADTDFFNSFYTARYGQIYGQYIYNIDSPALQGVNKVEIGFSPTPMVEVPLSNALPILGGTASGGTPIVIPKISKVNGQTYGGPTTFNIRLLTRSPIKQTTVGRNNGANAASLLFYTQPVAGCPTYSVSNYNVPLIDGTCFVLRGLEAGVITSRTFFSYPYVGHFDNPYNPTYDLDFGQNYGEYYPTTTVTNDNLFTTWWQQYMDQISDPDSYLVTAQMWLNPIDMSTFRFNDVIYLNLNQFGAQYYQVNKITGYNPISPSTCTVEFIKTNNLVVTKGRVLNMDPHLSQGTMTTGHLITSTKNTWGTGHTVIAGDHNIVSMKNVMVNGNYNNSGSSGHVIGNNHNIEANSDNTFVHGEGVYVYSDNNSAVVLGGQNIRIRQSGGGSTTNCGNSFIQIWNANDAGMDVVLNPYSKTTPINLIDAGMDVVRRIGSAILVSKGEGGMDIVF